MQIGVDKDENVPAGVIDAGHDGRGLAEIAAEVDDLQFMMFGGSRAQLLVRSIHAAIIYRNDLKIDIQASHYAIQGVQKRSDIFFFVEDRNNDRDFLRFPVRYCRGSFASWFWCC